MITFKTRILYLFWFTYCVCGRPHTHYYCNLNYCYYYCLPFSFLTVNYYFKGAMWPRLCWKRCYISINQPTFPFLFNWLTYWRFFVTQPGSAEAQMRTWISYLQLHALVCYGTCARAINNCAGWDQDTSSSAGQMSEVRSKIDRWKFDHVVNVAITDESTPEYVWMS